LALMEMYVEGVSTRKVKEITEELCGTSFSKSLVSSLAGSLDSELEGWRNRALEAEAYPYVFVDARYEKVRMDHRIVSQGVLIVSAVREPDGLREILAVEVADTESEAAYQELFRSLKARGLSGVELVVCDEHEGIKAAVARHFQGASHQRCQVHYSRNLLGMVGANKRKELGRIYEGSSPRQRGTPPSVSPPRWPTSGERRATRRLQPTSRSTSRSASLAWPSRNPTAGASAQPTAWRGSERGAKEAYAGG
jgi:transposase-like protein